MSTTENLASSTQISLDLNNNNVDVTITLTPSIQANFNYTWQDDSSFVGHAQQSYINDKVEINVYVKCKMLPMDLTYTLSKRSLYIKSGIVQTLRIISLLDEIPTNAYVH